MTCVLFADHDIIIMRYGTNYRLTPTMHVRTVTSALDATLVAGIQVLGSISYPARRWYKPCAEGISNRRDSREPRDMTVRTTKE